MFDIDRSVVNKHLKNIYESGAAPEDVAEVIAELLSELQDISDDKALTAAGYFHTKSNRTLRKNAKQLNSGCFRAILRYSFISFSAFVLLKVYDIQIVFISQNQKNIDFGK